MPLSLRTAVLLRVPDAENDAQLESDALAVTVKEAVGHALSDGVTEETPECVLADAVGASEKL